jgi:hypothetical protein
MCVARIDSEDGKLDSEIRVTDVGPGGIESIDPSFQRRAGWAGRWPTFALVGSILVALGVLGGRLLKMRNRNRPLPS